MVRVISYRPKAASPPHTDGSIVFARWRQCAPMKRMLPWAHPTLQPKPHVDRFVRFLHSSRPCRRTWCAFYGRPMDQGRPLYFCTVVSFFLFLSPSFLAHSQRSDIGCLPYFYTWCDLSANLEFRSEMCCTRLAGNTGSKNDAKSRQLRTIAQLCRAVSSEVILSTTGKKLNSNISSTCSHNMANFGPVGLTAEIFLEFGAP